MRAVVRGRVTRFVGASAAMLLLTSGVLSQTRTTADAASTSRAPAAARTRQAPKHKKVVRRAHDIARTPTLAQVVRKGPVPKAPPSSPMPSLVAASPQASSEPAVAVAPPRQRREKN